MRVPAIILAALLLSSCAWVRREIALPAPAPPAAKPEPAKPHKPRTERPAPRVQTSAPATEAAQPVPLPPNYSARCHAMADNRANDAKQLGVSAADQARVQSDTYRDCMAQSVK